MLVKQLVNKLAILCLSDKGQISSKGLYKDPLKKSLLVRLKETLGR